MVFLVFSTLTSFGQDLQITIAPVTCFGGYDGSVNVTLISTQNCGNGPYQYQLIGPQSVTSPITASSSFTFTNLSAGNYTINVLVNGLVCTQSSLTITQPNALTAVNSNPVNVTCYGNASGTILVTAVNGTAPYNVSWSGPSSGNPPGIEINVSGGTFNITSLLAGNYTATVIDANGCTTITPFTITQPNQLTASSSLTQVSCFGGANGTATITASNGTAPYNVSWSGPSSGNPPGIEINASGGTFNITSLLAGTYTYTVTDANSCTANTSITITQPSALTVSGVVVSNNIDLSVTGGTLPYNYSWSNGAVTQDLPNVSPGTYVVLVTDANNCTVSDTFVVNNAAIEEKPLDEITLFPNPTNDQLTIRRSVNSLGHHSYVIQDSYGRKVLEGSFEDNEETLSVAHLAPGLYQLQVGVDIISFIIIH